MTKPLRIQQDLRNWHSVGTFLTNGSSGKKAAFLGDHGSRSESASGNAEHQTATKSDNAVWNCRAPSCEKIKLVATTN